MQEVHDFVDPKLHRVHASWDDLTVPGGLRDVAEATWDQLVLLADPGGDTPETHARLDELRRAYAALYAEAEALTQSSIDAAGPAYLRATAEDRVAQEEAERQAAYAARRRHPQGLPQTRRAAGPGEAPPRRRSLTWPRLPHPAQPRADPRLRRLVAA